MLTSQAHYFSSQIKIYPKASRKMWIQLKYTRCIYQHAKGWQEQEAKETATPYQRNQHQNPKRCQTNKVPIKVFFTITFRLSSSSNIFYSTLSKCVNQAHIPTVFVKSPAHIPPDLISLCSNTVILVQIYLKSNKIPIVTLIFPEHTRPSRKLAKYVDLWYRLFFLMWRTVILTFGCF